MLKAVQKRNIVRASTKPHREGRREGCIYSGVNTLEPSLVDDTWGTLSEDTFAIEIAQFPALLHRAFLSELRKRAKHA